MAGSTRAFFGGRAYLLRLERGLAGGEIVIEVGGADGLGMSMEINRSDWGFYKDSNTGKYSSRIHLGAFGSFTVGRINAYWWNCRHSGHSSHRVLAVLLGGDFYAGCDCYDFQHYGKAFGRACSHIWRIYLHEDIMEF